MKNITMKAYQANQTRKNHFPSDLVEIESGLLDPYLEKGNLVSVEQAVATAKLQQSVNERFLYWR